MQRGCFPKFLAVCSIIKAWIYVCKGTCSSSWVYYSIYSCGVNGAFSIRAIVPYVGVLLYALFTSSPIVGLKGTPLGAGQEQYNFFELVVATIPSPRGPHFLLYVLFIWIPLEPLPGLYQANYSFIPAKITACACLKVYAKSQNLSYCIYMLGLLLCHDSLFWGCYCLFLEHH